MKKSILISIMIFVVYNLIELLWDGKLTVVQYYELSIYHLIFLTILWISVSSVVYYFFDKLVIEKRKRSN